MQFAVASLHLSEVADLVRLINLVRNALVQRETPFPIERCQRTWYTLAVDRRGVIRPKTQGLSIQKPAWGQAKQYLYQVYQVPSCKDLEALDDCIRGILKLRPKLDKLIAFFEALLCASEPKQAWI